MLESSVIGMSKQVVERNFRESSGHEDFSLQASCFINLENVWVPCLQQRGWQFSLLWPMVGTGQDPGHQAGSLSSCLLAGQAGLPCRCS